MNELVQLASHPMAVRVSLALLHFLWQGAALAAVAFVALSGLRKSSASKRYLVLLALFALMAACPVVTFLVIGRPPALPEKPVAPVISLDKTAQLEAAANAPITERAIASNLPEPDRAALIREPIPQRAAFLSLKFERLSAALPWVNVLWLAGVVILSLRLLARWGSLRRLGKGLQPAEPRWQELLASLSRRLHLSRPARLMVSLTAQAPMVLGWLRPVIVLPITAFTGLTPEQLSALLVHELAHLRRYDHWVNLAQTLIELLLFYHPAVWWISRTIRAERENCCDDMVVGISGDTVSYMKALAWVEEHREKRLRPVLAASGSPLLQRILRLAGRPVPMESRQAWLAAVLALTLALAVPLAGGISPAASEVEGHMLGAREQWQPERESDARLQQQVRLEILGRAAIPTLEMLTEKTGVTLKVAPEHLETVGERKLTLIAQGCSLKSLMVQIPRALQECHWDIDLTGKEPMYLLHRNGSVETRMLELWQNNKVHWQEERRPERELRLEEARKALAMSPEELDDLAKTYPLLVATIKDTETKHRLELLLSLPEKDMQEFIETGRAYLEYKTAPEAYQEAAQKAKESFLKDAVNSESEGIRAWAKIVTEVLPNAGICFEDYYDGGIFFLIQCYDEKGVTGRKGDFLRAGGGSALLPWLPDDHSAKYRCRPLLLKTGYDEKTADAVLADLVKQRTDSEQEKRDQKRALEWREPDSPELHKIVTLPFKEEYVDKVEMQKFIAKESGLSLVSDYFTTWGSGKLPEEAKGPVPIWRLLYLLGDSWFWSYEWDEVGDCLVFHDNYWYQNAPQEFPESMELAYREKLKRQGRFTLDDVAAAAVELARRRPVPPRQRGEWPWTNVNVPSDLREAGLKNHVLRAEVVLIYASLTPEQRKKAQSAAGLPYADMTSKQKAWVQPYAFLTGGWNNDKHALLDEEIPQAVFRIKNTTEQQKGQLEESYELQIEFPSLQTGTGIWFRPLKATDKGS